MLRKRCACVCVYVCLRPTENVLTHLTIMTYPPLYYAAEKGSGPLTNGMVQANTHFITVHSV